MNFVRLVLLLLLVAPLGAAPRVAQFRSLHGPAPVEVHDYQGRVRVEIYEPGVSVPEDFPGDVLATLGRLEQVFGDFEAPLRIKIGGGSQSLAIAYSPAEDAIAMPGGPKVLDYGLRDRDRLHHEMFHAVVGRTLPHRVTPEALKEPDAVALHEGAADFFASLLDENDVFGENYFLEPTELRHYRSSLRFSLSRGGHARGNALTAYLLQQDFNLGELASFFQGECFQVSCLVRPEHHRDFGLDPHWRPETRVGVLGLPPSRKGRYRVRPGDLLGVEVNPVLHQLAPDLEVRFRDAHGAPLEVFDFTEVERHPGGIRFRIEPRAASGAEKVIARYLHEGRVIGFDVLYLSVARER